MDTLGAPRRSRCKTASEKLFSNSASMRFEMGFGKARFCSTEMFIWDFLLFSNNYDGKGTSLTRYRVKKTHKYPQQVHTKTYNLRGNCLNIWKKIRIRRISAFSPHLIGVLGSALRSIKKKTERNKASFSHKLFEIMKFQQGFYM